MSKIVSKDKILEIYLNNFFVGRGLVGVEVGVCGYFDKFVVDFILVELVFFVGLIKNLLRFLVYKIFKLEGNEIKEDLENKLLFFVNIIDDDLDDFI